MPTLQSTIEANVNAAAQQIAAALIPGIIEALRTSTMDQVVAFMAGRETSPGPQSSPGPKRGRPKKVTAGTTAARTTAPPKKGPAVSIGRLPRRTDADLQNDVRAVVALLQSRTEGLGAEAIRSELGIDPRALPKTLALALEQKAVSKQGERRGTKYFAGGGSSKGASASTAKGETKKASSKATSTGQSVSMALLSHRTTGGPAGILERIATILGESPDGMRAETLRAAIGVEKPEFVRAIGDGLSSGRLAKTGEKRATTYTLGSGAKPAAEAAATPKKLGRPKKKTAGKKTRSKKS